MSGFSAGCVYIIPSGTVVENHYHILLNDADRDGFALVVRLTDADNLLYDSLTFEPGQKICPGAKLRKRTKVDYGRIEEIALFNLKDQAAASTFVPLGKAPDELLNEIRNALFQCKATKPKVKAKMASLGFTPP